MSCACTSVDASIMQVRKHTAITLSKIMITSYTQKCHARLTLEFSGTRSVSAATPCSAACQSTPPVVQLTQLVIPATRKPFQLPSGIFLLTPSTVPRT